MHRMTGALLMALALPLAAGTEPGPVAHYPFDGATANAVGTSDEGPTGVTAWFTGGLVGQALSLRAKASPASLHLDAEGLPLDGTHAFSVQLWARTVANADRRFVLLGQKDIADNGLASQKQKGWVFYASDGTWARNMGSGDRRLTYERDNGEHMPINDGRWHQLTMTFDPAERDPGAVRHVQLVRHAAVSRGVRLPRSPIRGIRHRPHDVRGRLQRLSLIHI